MDYEHQPANHIAFRLADTVLLPAALAATRLRPDGRDTQASGASTTGSRRSSTSGTSAPIRRSWRPSASTGAPRPWSSSPARRRRGRSTTGPTTRSSPRPCGLSARRRRRVAWCSPAVPSSAAELIALGLPNLVIPERAVDARSLMHASDLVIGAGGTMTREGALLGVPTVSVFSGPDPGGRPLARAARESCGASRTLRTFRRCGAARPSRAIRESCGPGAIGWSVSS